MNKAQISPQILQAIVSIKNKMCTLKCIIYKGICNKLKQNKNELMK